MKVAQIATSEVEEDFGNQPEKDETAAAMGRKGGTARAAKLNLEERSDIARRAAARRWKTDVNRN